MKEHYSEQEIQRLHSYLNIHLKKEQRELPEDEQIEALHKRDRNKWIHFAINLLALLIFGYSFYFDLTRMSRTFFIIIAVIFSINVLLIFYQKKQIRDLIEYLRWKKRKE